MGSSYSDTINSEKILGVAGCTQKSDETDTSRWFRSHSGNSFKVEGVRFSYLALGGCLGDEYQRIQSADSTTTEYYSCNQTAAVSFLHYAGVCTCQAVSCGSPPEHWFLVLRNLDTGVLYRLHFCKQGVIVDENIDKPRTYLVNTVAPKGEAKSGRDIANWLEKVGRKYSLWHYNCQHFVQKVCEFM